MNDAFGTPLAPGDLVAYASFGGRGNSALVKGTIAGFTPKKVRVAHDTRWGPSPYITVTDAGRVVKLA